MRYASFFILVIGLVSLSANAQTSNLLYYGQSKVNSTTTPLGSSETFTGDWELVPQPDVLIRVVADALGTLYTDLSYDGTTVDSTFPSTGFEIAANIPEFHRVVKGGVYFRVRIVNGTTPQTSLRVSTVYGSFSQGNLPLSESIASDADAIVVRSVNSQIDLALGRVGGFEGGTKFGRNPDIDTGAAEDMWNGGSTYTGHPVSYTPETVNVFSSSAADTSAGTGARTIRIFGLKTNTSEEYESEDITLNGVTAVTSTATWWRVNRAYVLTAGSGGANAGTITIRPTTTTASVFVQMPTGLNQTTIGAYTVPFNRQLVVKRIRASIVRSTGSAGSATITLRVRESGGVYRAVRAFELQTGDAVNYTSFGGEVFPALSDIKFRIEQVSDNNTVSDAAFEYVLVGQ